MVVIKPTHTLMVDDALVGLSYKGTRYLIGFGSVHHARKVQYDMAMPVQKAFKLLPSVDKLRIRYGLNDILVDREATLFVNKRMKQAPANVMDYGVCLEMMDAAEFLSMPFQKHHGIIMPTKLLDETSQDMTFRCVTMDPLEDSFEKDFANIRASLEESYQENEES